MAHRDRPSLIAHRGDAARFPENTLGALRGAIEAGCAFVEFDVQLTADLVPVVIHDASLARTAGVQGSVLDMPWAQLREIAVGEPDRFGDRFAGERIPRLADAVALLAASPHVTAFIELKRASLRRFGLEPFVARVLAEAAPLAGRGIAISYDAAALLEARRRGAGAIGWVIERWDDTSQQAARELGPDYLFAKRTLLPEPPEPLWPGNWSWAVYDVDDPEEALAIVARGVRFVETRAVGELLADPRLCPGGSAHG